MKRLFAVLAMFLLPATLLVAHPHIQKSVHAQLGDVEAVLSFYTTPANPAHVESAPVGEFSTSYARLSLSGELKTGGLAIPAGDYTLGAIKQADGTWVMALAPGKLEHGQKPEMATLLRLESSFSTREGTAHHVDFNIEPGRDQLEGRATLVWHYGQLFLAGALTAPAQ